MTQIVNAKRFPEWLGTKQGRTQHRVKELHLNFEPGMRAFRNGQPSARAIYLCGNSGGSHDSPLMERADLPRCKKCLEKMYEDDR